MRYNTYEFMNQVTNFYNFPIGEIDLEVEKHNLQRMLTAGKEYMYKLPEENTSDAIYKSGVAYGIDMAISLISKSFSRMQTIERTTKIENNELRREIEELREKKNV